MAGLRRPVVPTGERTRRQGGPADGITFGHDPLTLDQGPHTYGSPSSYGSPMYGQPVRRPMGPRPESHLVLAILSTLFCCLPLGIAAIVNASRVDGRYAAGDYAGARDASDKAKRYATLGAVIGLVVGVLYFFVVLGNLAPADTY